MKRRVDNLHLVLMAAVIALSGCGMSAQISASGGAYAGDDMYAAHDIKAISAREKAEDEAARAIAEAREAEFRAKAAEFGDKLASNNSRVVYKAPSTDGLIESTYEGAYARRLKGFESDTYQPEMSNRKLARVYDYDPEDYNLMVSGDQVWVEPKYITAFFGTWGAEKIGTRTIYSRFDNPYAYRSYWGYGWRAPYVGWTSYSIWNYPLGWGTRWWTDPFYSGYYGWWDYRFDPWWYSPWWHGPLGPYYDPYYGWSYPSHGTSWGPAHSPNHTTYRPTYGSGSRSSYATALRNDRNNTSSARSSYSGAGYRQSTSSGGNYSSGAVRSSSSSSYGSSSRGSYRGSGNVNRPSSVTRGSSSGGTASRSGIAGSNERNSIESHRTVTRSNSRSSSSRTSFDGNSSFRGSSSSSSFSGGSSFGGGGGSHSGGSSGGSYSGGGGRNR